MLKNQVRRAHLFGIGCGFAALAASGAVAAQEDATAAATLDAELAPSAAAVGNTVIYDQAFFARYNLTTAEDLLRRIPGVPTILDATTTVQPQPQQRGFGSTGSQVLLGGRRFPGKTNEIATNLRRIPAANVARVELIRGSASGIDVQSEGVVVNVVLRDGVGLGGSGSAELNQRFNDEGWRGIDGLASYGGSIGALGWSAGIERNLWSPPASGTARWTNRFRDESYYYPDGTLQELRPQSWSREHHK